MVGQTLKHYQIEAELGRGGMGVVYRARDLRLGRPVALKVLASDVTSDPERRKRFVREAQSAAAVTHPSIAQVYDVDESDGVIFIAMEFVEGRTVRQLIGERDIDLLGSIDIAIQVSEGLGKAHDAGIVHRDIKSDNVMVTPEGHAKLLDFGLAKLVEPEGSDPAELPTQGLSTARTQAGMVLGTIAYMSPEQARGRAVDQRSDIFSLGVMLYEMSTGQLPFSGTSPLDTMHAIAFDETRPVTEIRPGLPPDLQRIVSRCLRKRPEDRYLTTKELVEDLRRLRTDTESGKIRALSMGERLRDRIASFRQVRAGGALWLAGFLALTVLLILALAGNKNPLGSLVFYSIVGLLIWRRVRNRRGKLIQRFVARLRKQPEVRLVTVHENAVTVLVDTAQAGLYPQVHGMLDALNRKLYFGEPLTLSIREDVPATEVRRLLQSPGVLYVRQDVLATSRISGIS